MLGGTLNRFSVESALLVYCANFFHIFAGMSKKEKSVEAKKAKKPSRGNYLREKINALRKSRGLKAIGAIAVVLLLSALSGVALAKTAMLYLLGDNGLKSGRASGNVYQRNGRVRQFKVPALVRNTYTALARTFFATNSSGWNALSDEERQSWINLQLHSTDRFGRDIILTGKAAYNLVNGNLNKIGLDSIDSPVEGGAFELILMDVVTLTNAGTGTVTFQLPNGDPVTAIPAGESIALYATAPLSPGISRPSQSAFRLIDVIPSGTDVDPNYDFNAAYVDKFGTPITDRKAFFQIEVVNETTGLASARTQAVVTIG